jgi:hypothetical protein
MESDEIEPDEIDVCAEMHKLQQEKWLSIPENRIKRNSKRRTVYKEQKNLNPICFTKVCKRCNDQILSRFGLTIENVKEISRRKG